MPKLQARIQSYELAFRMQRRCRRCCTSNRETAATQTHVRAGRSQPRRKFGRVLPGGPPAGRTRRAVRAGLRRPRERRRQVGHAQRFAARVWPTTRYSVDQPVAGLLRDLKQRGLLDETLVCFVTEFGRTPGGQGTKATGREHSPYGFSVWLAGGGIKGGVVHGATDELGFHAVENRHYVTDIHATVLHLLGLDPRQLEVPGRKRLEIDFGNPIREIIV